MSTKTIETKVIEKPLSSRERMKLAELERQILKDFAAFYRVGRALAEINEKRLYRNDEGRTFEQYCKELWDMSKSRAYQVIDASEVFDHLQLQCQSISSTNCGQNDGDNEGGKLLPLNEAQVRPLARLKDRPEQLALTWKTAVETAPNGKPTAAHVKRTVNEYLGEKFEKTVRKAREKVAENSNNEFSVAFENLSQQILEAKKSNYKHTSRNEIVKALDQLRADLAEDGELIEETVFHGGSDDRIKLHNAGFKLFRTDRSSMTIKYYSGSSWKKKSGPFETVKEMEAEFKALMQDDMHLRG